MFINIEIQNTFQLFTINIGYEQLLIALKIELKMNLLRVN